MKKPQSPSLFSQLFPHGKRTQNSSIMISMCDINDININVNLTPPLEGFLMQSANEQKNNISLLRAQQKTYKINWGVKGGLGSGWCGEHHLHCSPFWISCRYTLVISVLWCWSEEVSQNLSLRWGCCNWPFSGSAAGWPGHGYLQRMRGQLTKCWLLGRVKESASNIRNIS